MKIILLIIFVIFSKEQYFGCGNNNEGQLSIGNNITLNQITSLNNINILNVQFFGTRSYSSFLFTQTNTYVWGNNNFGQLGLNDNVQRNTPTILSFFNGNSLKDISFSESHSLFLTNTFQVYSSGQNTVKIHNKIEWTTRVIKLSKF
jgi:alpha-tubulin suppressor-like RCC1 family protein